MIRSLFDTENEPGEETSADSRSLEPEKSEVAAAEEPPSGSEPDAAGAPEQIKNVSDPERIGRMSDLESEAFGNEFDLGDNLLELESEIARIEDEVRSEQGNVRQEPPITASEKRTDAGPYSAAIEKAFQENDSAAAGADATENVSDPAPAQGFILPERTQESAKQEEYIFGGEVFAAEFKPESKAEIIRKSGLAWSAGIVFFASVIFLLIIGWFADLLLGTSPWAAVGGVILGSIIGFVQLFRLSRQILKKMTK